MQQAIKEIIKEKIIQSAHDVSDGGLFVTLVESAMVNNLGFEITSEKNIRNDAFLFGESQSRVVVSLRKDDEIKLVDELKKHNVKFSKLGFVKGKEMRIDNESFGTIAEAKDWYENVLSEILK